MSRMVELSDDVYERLEAEASATGTTPAEWIAARLPKCCPAQEGDGAASGTRTAADEEVGHPPTDSASPKTLADRMAGRIGRISSGRTDLSERVSEIFLEGLLEKKRSGHL